MGEPATSDSRPLKILVALFCAACLVKTFVRLFQGADFGDECAYIAIPWRFILGDRPFVDEINPIQTSTFITLPFIRLFVWGTGGLDGVVLYMRVLYFAFCCAVASAAFACLRRSLGVSLSLAVAIAIVLFVPFGMPALSYNTLASGFFALGVFLGMRTILDGRRDSFFFLAGLAHGLASVAIPTYVIPGVCFVGIAAFGLSRERRLRRFSIYAAGGVLAAGLFLPYFLHLSDETLAFSYSYTNGVGAWVNKLYTLLWQMWRIQPHKVGLIVAVLGFLVLGRFKAAFPALLLSIAFPLLILLPIEYVHIGRSASSNSVFHATLLALFAPVLFVFLWRSLLARQLFLGVWVPSACAGLIAGWTSGNGLPNAGHGFLPAALVTCVLAGLFAREAAQWTSLRFVRHLALAVPLISALLLWRYQEATYLDDDVSSLDARIGSGPLRGLHTTAEKKAWIEDISQAVTAHAPPLGRIFFALHFPLGYLLTSRPPAARSIWTVTCRPRQEEDCADAVQADLERFGKDGLLIVEVRRLFYSSRETRTQPVGSVNALIHERYRPIFDQPDYTLFLAP